MDIVKVDFSQLSSHRDLRVGLSLPSFVSFIDSYSDSKFPRVKLGKILSLEYGKGLKEEDRSGEGFPVMGSNGVVGYHEDYLIEGPAIIVGRKGSAGAITFIEENCYPIDTAFYVKLKNENYNMKFLSYLLRNAQLEKLTLYKGVPGLNRFDAYELIVPDVPTDIQNKIMEKILPFEKRKQKLENMVKDPIALLNDLFSVFYANDLKELWRNFGKRMSAGTQRCIDKESNKYNVMFNKMSKSNILRFSARYHDPNMRLLEDILTSKPYVRIRDILKDDIRRGVQPKYDEDGDVVVIKTGQLKNNYIDLSESEYVSSEFYNIKEKAQINKGDVLLASTGKGSIGKVDVYESEEEAIADGHVSIITIDHERYNPWFLAYFLRTILGVFQIEREYTGTTNQIEIYPDQVKEVQIPDLSIKEQEQYVNTYQEMLRKREKLLKDIQIIEDKILSVIRIEIQQE